MTALLLLAALAQPADAAKYLPDGAIAVVRVNVEPAMNAPLTKSDPKAFDQAMAELGKLVGPYGIDPRKDVKRVTVGISPDLPRGMVGVLEGTFDPAKIAAQLEAKAKDGKAVTAVPVPAGAVYRIEFAVPPNAAAGAIPGGPTTLYVGLLGPTHVAFGLDKEAVTTAFARHKGQAAAKVDAKLLELCGKLDPAQTVALAVVPGDLLAGTGEPFAAMQAISGGVAIATGVETRLRIATKTEASAGKLADELNQALNAARMLLPAAGKGQGVDEASMAVVANVLGTLKATAAGAEVKLDSTLTADGIKALGAKPTP